MIPSDSAAPTLRHRLSRHVGELMRLAVPVMVARAGLIVMATVDTIFVGRFATEELAFYGLANAPAGVIVPVMVGLLLGTVVLTAQTVGAGDAAKAGAVWRRSVPYSLLMGLVAGLLCLTGEPLFRLLGQDPALAAGGSDALAILGLGMPAAALYVTTAFFLEALKRPIPGMLAMLLANVLNVGLNWVLVFGKFGFPAMGADGAAWATTILRFLTAGILMAYVWWLPERKRFGIRGGFGDWWREGGPQRQVGYAAGVSYGLESSAFSALSIFAGWLGAAALAAYTIGLNLIALPFMAALGIASATAVRVGEAHGARNAPEMALAGWTGLLVSSLLLGACAVGFLALPGDIARLYASDADLIALTIPIVAFSAWILVVDGGQTVMASALRGRGDIWMPTALHFISYFAVMMPVSYALAFWAGRGVQGLFQGIFIASIVSIAVLSGRFAWLAWRDRPTAPALFASANDVTD